MNLVRWLSQQPQPATVRCITAEGDRAIRIDKKAKRPWGEASRAIETLQATRIEALDGQGNILRVFELEVSSSAEDATLRPTSQLQSDLQVVSQLLGRAYEHSTQVAFAHLCEVVRIAFGRLEGVERAWVRTLNQLASSSEQGPATGEDSMGVETLLQAFMQGQLQGAKDSGGQKKPGP
jgi:hypothetical protein